MELTKDDPAVLTNSGFVLAFVSGQLEEGAAYLKRAIDLDPNLASSWYWSGWVQIFLGNAAAIEHFHRSIRLSPLEPRIFIAYGGLAFSFLFAGQYDEASKWAEIAVRYNPQFLGSHRIAMACHALSGRLSDAREACSRAMKMDPTQRISNIRDRQPFRRDVDVAKLAEGFRLAGMPE